MSYAEEMKPNRTMTEQKMKGEKVLKKAFTWIPSLLLVFFYIPNALDKLLHPDQTGKIIENSAVMITAGIFILIGMALFLYNRTMLIGTSMLVLYMIAIVAIHLYKGKPSEVVILILIATLFASYIRQRPLLSQEGDT